MRKNRERTVQRERERRRDGRSISTEKRSGKSGRGGTSPPEPERGPRERDDAACVISPVVRVTYAIVSRDVRAHACVSTHRRDGEARSSCFVKHLRILEANVSSSQGGRDADLPSSVGIDEKWP